MSMVEYGNDYLSVQSKHVQSKHRASRHDWADRVRPPTIRAPDVGAPIDAGRHGAGLARGDGGDGGPDVWRGEQSALERVARGRKATWLVVASYRRVNRASVSARPCRMSRARRPDSCPAPAVTPPWARPDAAALRLARSCSTAANSAFNGRLADIRDEEGQRVVCRRALRLGLGHMTHKLCGKYFFPDNIGVSRAPWAYASSASTTSSHRDR